jgi:hypothetical protein
MAPVNTDTPIVVADGPPLPPLLCELRLGCELRLCAAPPFSPLVERLALLERALEPLLLERLELEPLVRDRLLRELDMLEDCLPRLDVPRSLETDMFTSLWWTIPRGSSQTGTAGLWPRATQSASSRRSSTNV